MFIITFHKVIVKAIDKLEILKYLVFINIITHNQLSNNWKNSNSLVYPKSR